MTRISLNVSILVGPAENNLVIQQGAWILGEYIGEGGGLSLGTGSEGVIPGVEGNKVVVGEKEVVVVEEEKENVVGGEVTQRT